MNVSASLNALSEYVGGFNASIRGMEATPTSVGSLSPVSSTVAVCPYLAMSETSPPMLSSVVVFTGRHKPSGAFTKPCISARQTPSVTVNGSAVCPQVKNKEFRQTNEAGRKRGGGEPSYAAKAKEDTKIGVGQVGSHH